MSKLQARRLYSCRESDVVAETQRVGPIKLTTVPTSEMKSMQLATDKCETAEDDSSNQSGDPSPAGNSAEGAQLHSSFRMKLMNVEDTRKWTLIQTDGTKPAPRYNHAAAVVGRKLLVIGGENGSEIRNDVQMLHLGKLTWSKIGVGDSAPSKGLPIKKGPIQELPKCKGHSLISWGKTVILIGGLSDAPAEKIEVWSFDLEMDCWTTVVTKGEIPPARSGHSVTRAGSMLVMFGGEDAKGRKLNDLRVLDLKSLMWLPLNPTGKGPSPRARHVADMYDDRFLFIFGGETKSKISHDTYALDFENMEWSRLKTRGVPPIPRAGHAGAMVGSFWYIVGGESRTPGLLDTTVLDMSRMEWSVAAPANPDSASGLQGLSLIFVQRKDRRFLVAFGGVGAQASSEVQVLHIPIPEQPQRKTLAGLLEIPTTPERKTSGRYTHFLRSHQGPQPTLMGATIPCACVNVAKSNLDSVADRRSMSQRSSSRFEAEFDADLDRDSGLVPLRMRYAMAQNSKVAPPPLGRRSTSQNSSSDRTDRWGAPPKDSWESLPPARRKDLVLPRVKSVRSHTVAASEESNRQQQSAQRIRGDLQESTEMTAPVVSGLLNAEELQISAPSVRPGLLSSVGDAGKLFPQTRSSISSRTRSCHGGSQSSEFSGYAETFISRTGEVHASEPSMTNAEYVSSADSQSCNPDISSASPRLSSPDSILIWGRSNEGSELTADGSPDEMKMRADFDEINQFSWERNSGIMDAKSGGLFSNILDVGEDDYTILSRVQTAECPDERRIAVTMLVQRHEQKLAAAIRTGQLLAGQCAEALRNRDEAERTVHTVKQKRQRAERRLSAALKQRKEVESRLSATEQAREESNMLVRNIRVENLKLEQDLALKTSLLGEVQKELQATRGILLAEGTRAFQLQVELVDLKHKLQSMAPRRPIGPYVQQPILA